ncbi:Meiotic recombination protein rec25 [Schizosaccharomyces pombe]
MVKGSVTNTSSIVKQFEKSSIKHETETIAFAKQSINECIREFQEQKDNVVEEKNTDQNHQNQNQEGVIIEIYQELLQKVDLISSELRQNLSSLQLRFQEVERDTGHDLLNVLNSLSQEARLAQKVLEEDGSQQGSQLIQGLLTCFQSTGN